MKRDTCPEITEVLHKFQAHFMQFIKQSFATIGHIFFRANHKLKFWISCISIVDEGNFNFDYRSPDSDITARLHTHRRRYQGEWWHLFWMRYQSQPAMEKAVLAARRKWWEGIRQPLMMDHMLAETWLIIKLKLPPLGVLLWVSNLSAYTFIYLFRWWNMKLRLQCCV